MNKNEIILALIAVSDFAKSDLVVGYCLTALLYVESYIDSTHLPESFGCHVHVRSYANNLGRGAS